jgi:hypothetical protein
MNRTISVVHHSVMAGTFRGQRKAPSCADCRRSQCVQIGRRWEFLCRLKHLVSDLAARSCPDFKDARMPSPNPR